MCTSLFSKPKISTAPTVEYNYAPTPPSPDEGAQTAKTGDERSDAKKITPATQGTNSLRTDLNIPGSSTGSNGLSIAGA